MLWSIALSRVITMGSLTVIDANGKSHHFGIRGSEPSAAIRLHERKLHYKLLFNPELLLGEAFMDGTLTMEQGRIYDFLDLVGQNLQHSPSFFLRTVENMLRPVLSRLQQFNPLARSRKNVAHHYDLSEKLYRLFLDEDMQYSCAYFPSPNIPLAQAQMRKKIHIAAKLALEPGMRVLDIGCGWGGMAIYLAQNTGAHITGITLSEEQLRVARARAKEAGLEDRVQFHLRDYRDETEQYDRIVSVGMFEHVGLPHYSEFFTCIQNLLKKNGVALLHSIGRMDGPGTTGPWLRKYIFPGGYAPALSEVLPCIEQLKLWATDIEILRLHYAETLRSWRERFLQNRDEVAKLYDERFCRMWEFYLAGGELDFRYFDTMVFQLQITRNIDAVPVTRDYMFERERELLAQYSASEQSKIRAA